MAELNESVLQRRALEDRALEDRALEDRALEDRALDDRVSEDLTARARIRDATIQLVAERGMGATTIRDIARAAGVSGGLVRHHFGSKDDLRKACDAHVLAEMMRLKERAVLDGQLADPGFISAAQPAMLVVLRYMARSMLDGSPAADSMFSRLVELGTTWLADHHRGRIADRTAYAALLVAMELGALVMSTQLSSVLGADVFSPRGHLRMARAKLDFYSEPLLSRELARRAHLALDELQQKCPERSRSDRSSGR